MSTDLFDNRKIKHIRKLPDGNNILLIWIYLLTLAGRCNAGGMIFLTENIPYTAEMLADESGFDINTVRLAIEALTNFGMISQNPLFVTGWEEHQNIEGMDKIREQNRLRKANQRAREKLLLSSDNRDSPVTVTQCHATDIDIEEDKERDKNKNYRFIAPTPDEVRAYCSERNNAVDAERFCDYYASKGWKVGNTPMKDWKAAVRNWERKDGRKKPNYSEMEELPC